LTNWFLAGHIGALVAAEDVVQRDGVGHQRAHAGSHPELCA
jgi:hypothetical protein